MADCTKCQEQRRELIDQRHALSSLAVDLHKARQRREFTQQWYAERIRKIEDVAKSEGIWPEIAAILANGSATRMLEDGTYVYDPPTYAQQLNGAKFRAEAAEKKVAALRTQIEQLNAQPCA